MATEIEHKYLVKNYLFKEMAFRQKRIRQGYLCREPEKTVRVRIKGDKGFITIKGLTRNACREEYEYEIPLEDAFSIMRFCEGDSLSKTRWYVRAGSHLWEVDEFHGVHAGLVVAEIELPDAGYPISLPTFVGDEVTGDPRYYNSILSK